MSEKGMQFDKFDKGEKIVNKWEKTEQIH